MTIKFMADMTFMIKSKRFMTVNGIVRGLPPSNHDGTFSNGTLGDPMFELVNDKRNALVHQVVEIGGLTHHFHHHANLKPREKSSNFFFNPSQPKHPFFPLPITDDPWGGGSGDTGCLGVRANEIPLGSSDDPRPVFVGSLSGRIWVTPSTLAPPSFACPWCESTRPKT